MAIAGAFLWVLRARFFRLDVLRFGTAMCAQSVEKGSVLKISMQISYPYREPYAARPIAHLQRAGNCMRPH